MGVAFKLLQWRHDTETWILWASSFGKFIRDHAGHSVMRWITANQKQRNSTPLRATSETSVAEPVFAAGRWAHASYLFKLRRITFIEGATEQSSTHTITLRHCIHKKSSVRLKNLPTKDRDDDSKYPKPAKGSGMWKLEHSIRTLLKETGYTIQSDAPLKCLNNIGPSADVFVLVVAVALLYLSIGMFHDRSVTQ